MVTKSAYVLGYGLLNKEKVVYLGYCISSINTASLISTPVRYYSDTNNFEMVVIFISNAPPIVPHAISRL